MSDADGAVLADGPVRADGPVLRMESVRKTFGSSVVLINAFRHGTRSWHLEAPRGMFDAAEPVAELMQR